MSSNQLASLEFKDVKARIIKKSATRPLERTQKQYKLKMVRSADHKLDNNQPQQAQMTPRESQKAMMQKHNSQAAVNQNVIAYLKLQNYKLKLQNEKKQYVINTLLNNEQMPKIPQTLSASYIIRQTQQDTLLNDNQLPRFSQLSIQTSLRLKDLAFRKRQEEEEKKEETFSQILDCSFGQQVVQCRSQRCDTHTTDKEIISPKIRTTTLNKPLLKLPEVFRIYRQ